MVTHPRSRTPANGTNQRNLARRATGVGSVTFKRPVFEARLLRLSLDAEPVEKIRAPQ